MANSLPSTVPTGAVPSSKIELHISCSSLPNMDLLSKSDPICVVYTTPQSGRTGTSNQWIKLGITEMIKDNLNPKFAKTFILEYFFEEVQPLKFAVYDVDDDKHIADLSRHDYIGEVEVTLAEIVSSGQSLTKRLKDPKRSQARGKIHLTAEELQDNKYDISFELSASKLDKKDFFGKSDPYFEISKVQEGGSYILAYRSEVVKKNLNPHWKPFTLSIQKLCGGDWNRTLKLAVYDWNSSGTPDFIGKTTFTLNDVCRGGIRNSPLINPELQRKKKGKYKQSGLLSFGSGVRATPVHSFVDYIRGGCDINLVVAIDFTASNGNPNDPKSLHFMNATVDNEYIYAIKSVGSVLAPYDSDQRYPCYGFGAKLPPSYQVSHCFALNGAEHSPEVVGIDGILGAYQYSISQVQLYGPTNFSSILERVMGMAGQTNSQGHHQSYYILLIITDGIITDMQNTVDRIVRASDMPLSIVIVGVGGADFTNMEILDADEEPLISRHGVKMKRDIVQFVPLRQFRKQRDPNNFSLARETLAEIPDQLVSYMKSKGIKPNPPVVQRRDTMSSLHPDIPPPYSAAPSLGPVGVVQQPMQPNAPPYPI